jgi:hypothetical protein
MFYICIIKKYSNSLSEALAIKDSNLNEFQTLKNEISDYINFLSNLNPSKETHYSDLNKWSEPAYNTVHINLKKHGFINGEPELNKKNFKASIWWKIYGMLSNINYSTFVTNENVALHHISAYNRNKAFIQELQELIK